MNTRLIAIQSIIIQLSDTIILYNHNNIILLHSHPTFNPLIHSPNAIANSKRRNGDKLSIYSPDGGGGGGAGWRVWNHLSDLVFLTQH